MTEASLDEGRQAPLAIITHHRHSEEGRETTTARQTSHTSAFLFYSRTAGAVLLGASLALAVLLSPSWHRSELLSDADEQRLGAGIAQSGGIGLGELREQLSALQRTAQELQGRGADRHDAKYSQLSETRVLPAHIQAASRSVEGDTAGRGAVDQYYWKVGGGGLVRVDAAQERKARKEEATPKPSPFEWKIGRGGLVRVDERETNQGRDAGSGAAGAGASRLSPSQRAMLRALQKANSGSSDGVGQSSLRALSEGSGEDGGSSRLVNGHATPAPASKPSGAADGAFRTEGDGERVNEAEGVLKGAMSMLGHASSILQSVSVQHHDENKSRARTQQLSDMSWRVKASQRDQQQLTRDVVREAEALAKHAQLNVVHPPFGGPEETASRRTEEQHQDIAADVSDHNPPGLKTSFEGGQDVYRSRRGRGELVSGRGSRGRDDAPSININIRDASIKGGVHVGDVGGAGTGGWGQGSPTLRRAIRKLSDFVGSLNGGEVQGDSPARDETESRHRNARENRQDAPPGENAIHVVMTLQDYEKLQAQQRLSHMSQTAPVEGTTLPALPALHALGFSPSGQITPVAANTQADSGSRTFSWFLGPSAGRKDMSLGRVGTEFGSGLRSDSGSMRETKKTGTTTEMSRGEVRPRSGSGLKSDPGSKRESKTAGAGAEIMSKRDMHTGSSLSGLGVILPGLGEQGIEAGLGYVSSLLKESENIAQKAVRG